MNPYLYYWPLLWSTMWTDDIDGNVSDFWLLRTWCITRCYYGNWLLKLIRDEPSFLSAVLITPYNHHIALPTHSLTYTCHIYHDNQDHLAPPSPLQQPFPRIMYKQIALKPPWSSGQMGWTPVEAGGANIWLLIWGVGGKKDKFHFLASEASGSSDRNGDWLQSLSDHRSALRWDNIRKWRRRRRQEEEEVLKIDFKMTKWRDSISWEE